MSGFCPLFLRERAGVRGSWLRSGDRPVPPAHSPASATTARAHPLTPTLSRREREQVPSWHSHPCIVEAP